MTTDHQVDGIIEELRAGLREQQTVLTEQQSVLAAQTERIALLEGERRSPRAARPTADDLPERRPRRLTRGGMLKAAAMGAIGLAGAEAASTLGAESAFADTGSATNYVANGVGGGGTGFQTATNSMFVIGGRFEALTGVVAIGTNFDAVRADSYSGHAVYGTSRTVPAGGSVVLGQTTSGTTIAADAAAVRGQIDDTGASGIGVYGLQGGTGVGVRGETAGAGTGVYGLSLSGTGIYAYSSSGTGVSAFSADGIGVYAYSLRSTAVSANAGYGEAVYARSSQLPDNGAVILAKVEVGHAVGVQTAAVRGQMDTTDANGNGVYGSHAGGGSGVYGASANGFGVFGDSASDIGVYGRSYSQSGTVFSVADGVRGYSDSGSAVHGTAGTGSNSAGGGYGGQFDIQGTGRAQLLLTPFGPGGHPTTGTHRIGEIFMDPNGNLFVCVTGGTPGTWKPVAYSGTGPTDARLRHFTIARHGDRVDFHWHMADGKGVAGFELYAAGRRLNRETIRPHRAKTYDASATWKGEGPFALHVLMRDGNVITVWPE